MIAKMKAHTLCCSFCGRSRSEVGEIVAGAPTALPGVPQRMVGKSAFICRECVKRCSRLMAGNEVQTKLSTLAE